MYFFFSGFGGFNPPPPPPIIVIRHLKTLFYVGLRLEDLWSAWGLNQIYVFCVFFFFFFLSFFVLFWLTFVTIIRIVKLGKKIFGCLLRMYKIQATKENQNLSCLFIPETQSKIEMKQSAILYVGCEMKASHKFVQF